MLNQLPNDTPPFSAQIDVQILFPSLGTVIYPPQILAELRHPIHQLMPVPLIPANLETLQP